MIDEEKIKVMRDPSNKLKLVMLRGLPSCGKTYRAMELAKESPNSVVISADDYFGEDLEQYRASWNYESAYQAHIYCESTTKTAMQKKVPLVIVANVSANIRDLKLYFELAYDLGYQFIIAEPTSPWWLKDIAPFLHNKNRYKIELELAAEFLYEKSKESHGVPLDTIKKMIQKYHFNLNFNDMLENFRSKQLSNVLFES